VCLLPAGVRGAEPPTFAATVESVQPKVVKIYGAGGLRGLEPYQSGFLISPEGHVLTVWSYVLDTDYITVTLNSGQKYQGELIGADPRYEIAILKIDADELSHFAPGDAAPLEVGDRVLAFSNLFGVATENKRPASCTGASQPRPVSPPAAVPSKRPTGGRHTCWTR
jgi:serine protease Do